MRWDNLFDDLESQWEGELRAEEAGLAIEEERLRVARLPLRSRLAALSAGGPPIRLLLASGRSVMVEPTTVGRDWVAGPLCSGGGGVGGGRSHAVVPFHSIQGVVLGREEVLESLTARDAERGISARLGLGYVLRDLSRRRGAVDIDLAAGGSVHGTIDRVATDHLDLAVHASGVPRREREVEHYRLIPLAALHLIRTG